MRSSIVSFIAIVVFVTLAVSVYLGLGWSGDGFSMSISKEQEKGNFHDLEVLFPYGFTDEDLEKIRAVEDVETVEGLYISAAFFEQNGRRLQAKLTSITKEIDTFTKVEGAVPSKPTEIAIEEKYAKEYGINIGDTITFVHDDKGNAHFLSDYLENEDSFDDIASKVESLSNPEISEDGMKYLKYDTYTVTALVEVASNVCLFPEAFGVSTTTNTPIDIMMYVPKESFDEESFLGYFGVEITAKSFDGYFYEEEYQKKNEEFKNKVDPVVNEICEAKNKRVVEAATTILDAIDTAPEKIEEYKKEIESGKAQIAEKEKELASMKQQLEDGREQLEGLKADTEVYLPGIVNFIDNVYSNVPQVQTFIDEARLHITVANQLYTYMKNKIQRPNMVSNRLTLERLLYNRYFPYPWFEDCIDTVENFCDKFTEGYYDTHVDEFVRDAENFLDSTQTLVDNIDDIYVALSDFTDSIPGILAEKEKELNANYKLYYNYKNQLEDKKKELQDYEEKIKNAEKYLSDPKVEDIKKTLRSVKAYDVSTLTRASSIACRAANNSMSIFKSVKVSMAMLFVVVGLLICYSSISRTVHEHITLIGTKKALGLSNREITLTYVCYSLLATIIGCGIGLVLGMFVIQKAMINTLSSMYFYQKILLFFDVRDMLLIFGIELIAGALVAFLACRSTLKQTAVKLLAGPKPIEGKAHLYEKIPGWDRLSLFTKTIINNFVTEKRRIFGTLIGIAGSTILVICGAGLYLNVQKSYERHFNNVMNFDHMLYFDYDDEESLEQIKGVLNEEGISFHEIYTDFQNVILPNGVQNVISLFVANDANFTESYKLLDQSGKEQSLSDNMWINYVYKDMSDAKPGDDVKIITNFGEEYIVPYAGDFEYYMPRMQAIMNKETYEKYYNKKYVTNALCISIDNSRAVDLEKKLSKIEGFEALSDYESICRSSFKSILSVGMVIGLLYIILAIVNVGLVLLNLLIMFVDQKKKEITILMINGYDRKSAKKYVYKDTVFLTILGTVLGCIIGGFVSISTIKSINAAPIYFITKPNILAILFGAGITLILALFATLISLRKIDGFRLTDIDR